MSHPFDEPLTPQERAMADRLARLGPHDGPSPALDAKILAAAHAAVAPRRSRRWLALSGIPATLVTGAGMAAVLALAVGVVWQLRPSAPAPHAPRDEADDFGYVTAEVIQRTEPAATAPPPPPPAEAPAPARALQAPPAMARREVAPAREPSIAAKQPAAKASDHFLDEAVDPAHAHPAPAVAAPAVAAKGVVAPAGRSDAEPRAFSYSEPPAPASPPAPAAAAPAPAAMAATAEGEQRQRAAAQAGAAAQRKEVANDAARQAQLRSQAASVTAAEADAAAGAAASDSTLDRIEVTGSTTGLSDQPVRGDRDLAPDQWLQRIRERRDSGDLDGARQSLELFRKTHPRLRLPDDLRALAAPTR
ncbi:hypothetical protein MNR01_04965 [Lysobacter sp. S4-A87]|uniref:hypothetical protein n=1 Tax=Lysobacter sp. S4-A87 TaxID=2925843 RepID=UPI001F53A120|nr:hypothetical protein [Lysobacter sp. S4-A87]UNK50375.1 hypothetical protein MNR01_04965 [Lysobacter sp. S4-A87]